MSKTIPKLIDCYSCSHCLGISIIQVITAYKDNGQIISLEDIAAYKCDIFDLVDEDSECLEFQPNKEITYSPKQWVEQ